MLDAHPILLKAAMSSLSRTVFRKSCAGIRSVTLMVDPIFPAIERGRNAINGAGGSTFNALLISDIARVHQAALCSPGHIVLDAVPPG
ncbi:hypothetical protein VCR4J5_1100002 [Vibrio crassostreae]|uniref:Uncharacterized protein n=1 Tax=Vibrio crassostreae TaxID=246167 RepID=A0ABM9QL66_9VIBR|nr:hypothetical protein VCR4J5_1100002 [Vibrio crassostreae]